MEPIKLRDRGAAVSDIQGKLLRLGYTLGPRAVDGRFGADTRRAVCDFQRDNSLEATGIVDGRSWARLVEHSYQLGDRLLYIRWPFQHGEDVRQLQELLAHLGFRVGPIDGYFGPLTDAAVRDFQRNMILPVDAIVGQATLGSLVNLKSIVQVHPRTLMSWSMVHKRELRLPLDGLSVYLEYVGAGVQDDIRLHRRRLTAQITALLHTAGAKVKARCAKDPVRPLPSADFVIGVGFQVCRPVTDIAVCHAQGDASSRAFGASAVELLSKTSGRSVELSESGGLSGVSKGIFLVMPEATEAELLSDEGLRQRVAVSVVHAATALYDPSGITGTDVATDVLPAAIG